MKFDELLEEVGEFGAYQKRVCMLAALIAITAGYQILSVVFLMEIPDHRCAIPGYDNDSYTTHSSYQERLIHDTVPLEMNSHGEAVFSKCHLFNTNITRKETQNNKTKYLCNKWVYDTSVFVNTVITEFDLICGNEIYRSVGTMVAYGGSFVGALVFGILADLVGRKKIIVCVVLLNVGGSVASVFINSYVVYTILGFIFGLTESALFMCAMCMAMEIVGPSKRTATGMAIGFMWTTGLFLLNAMAYFIRRWRHLRLALAIPPVIFIAMFWLLPESPRWLLSRGRYDEARSIIRKMARVNGVVVDELKLEKLTLDTDKSDGEKTLSFWHMWRNPTLAIRTLIIYFSSFTVNLVYYGVTINVGNLGGDIYLNFFISALAEITGSVATLLLLYRIGRRPMLSASMFLGGITCLASIFPVMYGKHSSSWALILISMIGKMNSASSTSVMDLYLVELFPTVVRQSSMATCYVFNSIGGMAAPYIADLGILVKGNLTDALPLIVFGSCSIVAGVLDLMLPETRNRHLPETIDDAIAFASKSRDPITIEVPTPELVQSNLTD